jgi:hypothetical protein
MSLPETLRSPPRPAFTGSRSTVARAELRVQSRSDDDPRMPSLDFFFDLLQLAIKERTQLALENIALRQQLAVYKRSVKRPNIKDGDRIFWMTVMRFLRE